jgi:hypothetical protein
LQDIALQKIYHLQHHLWYPSILQNINKYNFPFTNSPYLVKSLALVNQYNFHLDLTITMTTKGRHVPIRDYLPSLSPTQLNSLRKKRIMFMDQFTMPDDNYLLTWPEVKLYNDNAYKGPILG